MCGCVKWRVEKCVSVMVETCAHLNQNDKVDDHGGEEKEDSNTIPWSSIQSCELHEVPKLKAGGLIHGKHCVHCTWRSRGKCMPVCLLVAIHAP